MLRAAAVDLSPADGVGENSLVPVEELGVLVARELLALGDVGGLAAQLLEAGGVDLGLAPAEQAVQLAVQPPHLALALGQRAQRARQRLRGGDGKHLLVGAVVVDVQLRRLVDEQVARAVARVVVEAVRGAGRVCALSAVARRPRHGQHLPDGTHSRCTVPRILVKVLADDDLVREERSF